MSAIMDWLGIPLGYVMYFCYHVVGNYALAILLFTLVTKVILLPVAIWVQNNGIKIVRLTPELNHIKANFIGDRDRIAEETQKLYKREKYNAFANLIPTFIQLIQKFLNIFSGCLFIHIVFIQNSLNQLFQSRSLLQHFPDGNSHFIDRNQSVKLQNRFPCRYDNVVSGNLP